MVRTILFDLYLRFTNDYSRIPFHPCRETFPILLLILYLILGATYVMVDLKSISKLAQHTRYIHFGTGRLGHSRRRHA
jgi:hypothetical protein